MIDIYKILDKYKPDEDIFTEEDEEITKLKKVLYEKLDKVSLYCILMYAELGSLRKLAKELGVSASAASQKIIQIRQQIKKIYDNS